MRYPLGEAAFEQVPQLDGTVLLRPAVGQTATVRDLAGNQRDIWSSWVGGVASTSVTSDAEGDVVGWVDMPDFDIVYGDGTTRQVRITPPGEASPLSYGGVFDGIHDDLPSIVLAQESLPRTFGGTVNIPAGDGFCNGELPIIREGVVLRGVGFGPPTTGTTPAQTTSTLSFPDGSLGVHVHTAGTYAPDALATGTWAVIENLAIRAKGKTTANKDGIFVESICTIRDCFISGFSRSGIRIVANTGDTPARNANSWRVDNVRIASCDGDCFYVQGTDANAGLATNVQVLTAGAWGFHEATLLGNTYVGCLVEGAGAVDGVSGGFYGEGNASGRGVNKSSWIGCYTESGNPADNKIEAPNRVLFPLGDEANTGDAPTLDSGTSERWDSSATVFKVGSSAGTSTVKAGTESGTDDRFLTFTPGPNSGHNLRFRYQTDAYSWSLDGLDAQRPLQITDDLAPEGAGFLRLRRGFFITGSTTKGATNPAQRYVGNSDAIPTTGAWTRGDILYNTLPAAAGKVGWVCTASGTPGTWKAFGVIDA